ncbi:MAG: cytochrome-c oxidase, cbb3-type subunit II [Helicobacteraceae bacterium]|jgi:cytochrome c oxidase cbb3-type subunit 2|nr:cytochrome-c oxidase, cbb3-type subunit II [Helicobacteraceae bacterium]
MFHWLEKNPFFFAVFVFLTIAFAGLVEILPNFAQAARPVVGLKPFSVLELAGKNIYLKENCNACHSQLIRPFKSETDRYGHFSLSGEFAYDRPFVWGSKRTGPDLMRIGNYRTTDWHESHMKNPQATVEGSIMPPYPWLFNKAADIDTAYAEALTVNALFKTPYNNPEFGDVKLPDDVGKANALALSEAKVIGEDIKDPAVKAALDQGKIPEIVALIAYLNSRK